MKICLLAVVLLLAGQSVFSQSLKDVKMDLYYNHNKAALETVESLAASKQKPEVYYYLGIAQTKYDSLDAATQSFKKAKQIARKNDFPLSDVGLGRVAILQGDYDAAKQDFQQAWEDSKGRDANVLRGILEATALDPKADAKYALNLVDVFKHDRKNRKYEFTAEDYTAIGNVYANLPSGGGKAATNYETALNTNPKYARASYKLGALWSRARQDSLAMLNWHKSVESDPNYAPGLYELYSYWRVRDLDSAENYLHKYMSLTDDKLNAKIYLVDIMYLQENYQEAIDSAHALMKRPIKENTRTRLHKLIAVSKMKLGDFQKAKEEMDIYFDRLPKDKQLPFDYKTYADIMEKLGNQKVRLEYLNKYVNADTSTNVAFIRKTANELRKDNSFKAAELWFQKLFKVADSSQVTMGDYYYRALSLYGSSIHGIGSYDDAISSWDKFIKKYPDQPSGYYFKARTLQMKDTALVGLATDAYDEYISKLEPDELSKKQDVLENIYTYNANCAATQKDYAEAIKYADKLLSIDPHSKTAASVYGSMALDNLKAKKLDIASKYANKALSINPDNEVAPQILNGVKAMKDYQKKMDAYNKAKAEREKNK